MHASIDNMVQATEDNIRFQMLQKAITAPVWHFTVFTCCKFFPAEWSC